MLELVKRKRSEKTYSQQASTNQAERRTGPGERRNPGDHHGRGEHDPDLKRGRAQFVAMVAGEREVALLLGMFGAGRELLAALAGLGFGIPARGRLAPI